MIDRTCGNCLHWQCTDLDYYTIGECLRAKRHKKSKYKKNSTCRKHTRRS